MVFLITTLSCDSEQVKEKIVYQNTVGDIAFDKDLDDPEFKICFPYCGSPQYYKSGLQYTGEMFAIKSEFLEKYNVPKVKGQTGFITIRFVINCEGESGRFRIYSVNTDLEEFTFNAEITNKLRIITSGLDSWEIKKFDDGNPMDYYQYLSFKIVEGQIIEIAP